MDNLPWCLPFAPSNPLNPDLTHVGTMCMLPHRNHFGSSLTFFSFSSTPVVPYFSDDIHVYDVSLLVPNSFLLLFARFF